VVFSSIVFVVFMATFSTFAWSKVYNYMLLKKSFKLANMTKANYFTFLNMINLPHKKTLKLEKKLERSNSEIGILLVPFCWIDLRNLGERENSSTKKTKRFKIWWTTFYIPSKYAKF
jgi:hypothetical protein